jgi:hypothetical protein
MRLSRSGSAEFVEGESLRPGRGSGGLTQSLTSEAGALVGRRLGGRVREPLELRCGLRYVALSFDGDWEMGGRGGPGTGLTSVAARG